MAEAALTAALKGLAGQLEGRIEELVQSMLENLLVEPGLEHYDEPHFRTLASRIARENLLHEIYALQEERQLPQSCPPEAAMAARQAVELDAPVTVVLLCYRAGHAVLWSAWLDLVTAFDAPETLRTDLLRAGSEFMFAYVERCTSFVIDEYTRVREESVRSRDHQSLQAIRQVLADRAVDEAALDYPLSINHLGFVAWGPGAEVLLRQVAGAARGSSLIVPGDDGTTWAWLGARRPILDRVTAALEALEVPEDSGLALGTWGGGVDGFRRTHREAQDARAVAARLPAPITRYDAMALESLALVAEVRARDFVARELGALAGSGSRPERLRATLNAYFAADQNAAAAADRLVINERTVRNRLQLIEELLGYPPVSRRAELEVALRFDRVLPQASASASPK